jgi:hypothetical protein
MPSDPGQALTGRKRYSRLFSRHAHRRREQDGHAARHEDIELAPRANRRLCPWRKFTPPFDRHVNLDGQALAAAPLLVPLDPLSLPVPLPKLFAVHAGHGSEGVRHRRP